MVDHMLLDKLEGKGAAVKGSKQCEKTTAALQVSKGVLHMDDPAKRYDNILVSEIIPRALLGEPGPLPWLFERCFSKL